MKPNYDIHHPSPPSSPRSHSIRIKDHQLIGEEAIGKHNNEDDNNNEEKGGKEKEKELNQPQLESYRRKMFAVAMIGHLSWGVYPVFSRYLTTRNHLPTVSLVGVGNLPMLYYG